MSAQTIDYDALAKQYGATTAPPAASQNIDYDALAKQHGAVDSAPPPPATDWRDKVIHSMDPDVSGDHPVKNFALGAGQGISSMLLHPVDTFKAGLPAMREALSPSPIGVTRPAPQTMPETTKGAVDQIHAFQRSPAHAAGSIAGQLAASYGLAKGLPFFRDAATGVAAPALETAGEALQKGGVGTMNKLVLRAGDKAMRYGANPGEGVLEAGPKTSFAFTKRGLANKIGTARDVAGENVGKVITQSPVAVSKSAVGNAIHTPANEAIETLQGPGGNPEAIGSVERLRATYDPLVGPEAPEQVSIPSLWEARKNIDRNINFSRNPSQVDPALENIRRGQRAGLADLIRENEPASVIPMRQYANLQTAAELAGKRVNDLPHNPNGLISLASKVTVLPELLRSTPAKTGLATGLFGAGRGLTRLAAGLNPAEMPIAGAPPAPVTFARVPPRLGGFVGRQAPPTPVAGYLPEAASTGLRSVPTEIEGAPHIPLLIRGRLPGGQYEMPPSGLFGAGRSLEVPGNVIAGGEKPLIEGRANSAQNGETQPGQSAPGSQNQRPEEQVFHAPTVAPSQPASKGNVANPLIAAPIPETAAPATAPAEATPRAPKQESPTLAEIPTQSIQRAPGRFQYKGGTDAEGVGTLLKEQSKYNPDLGGVISVWKDPADGKTYVINGHHRLELALRTNTPTVAGRYINAADAGEARAIGALQNIAEGRGSAVDAAKFMRDSGISPADLKAKGISMGEATAKNGVSLANLDDELFHRVTQGDIPEGRAIAISEATPSHSEQKALLDLVESQEKKGKRITNDVIRELADFVTGSGTRTETTASLFGDQQVEKSLAMEKAEVSAYVKQQLSKDRKLFGYVSNEGRASELQRVGNKLDTEKNREIAQSAQQAEAVYDKLKTFAGPINNALQSAAEKLAAGKDANAAKQESYAAIRKAVSETLGRGEEPGAGGAQATPGGSQPAGPTGSQPTSAVEPTPRTSASLGLLDNLNFRRRSAPPSGLLPGFENAPAERAQANAEAEGERLTEAVSAPKGDISGAAGKMERESPLFGGTEAGGNRNLFATPRESLLIGKKKRFPPIK